MILFVDIIELLHPPGPLQRGNLKMYSLQRENSENAALQTGISEPSHFKGGILMTL